MIGKFYSKRSKGPRQHESQKLTPEVVKPEDIARLEGAAEAVKKRISVAPNQRDVFPGYSTALWIEPGKETVIIQSHLSPEWTGVFTATVAGSEWTTAHYMRYTGNERRLVAAPVDITLTPINEGATVTRQFCFPYTHGELKGYPKRDKLDENQGAPGELVQGPLTSQACQEQVRFLEKVIAAEHGGAADIGSVMLDPIVEYPDSA